jgi:hypothetical protein
MKVKNTEGLEGKSLLAKVFLQKKMGVSEFFFKESGMGTNFFVFLPKIQYYAICRYKK